MSAQRFTLVPASATTEWIEAISQSSKDANHSIPSEVVCACIDEMLAAAPKIAMPTQEQIRDAYTEHDTKFALVSSIWSFEAGIEYAFSLLQNGVTKSPSSDAGTMKLALDALRRGRSQIMGVLVQQDQDEAIAALEKSLEACGAVQLEKAATTLSCGCKSIYGGIPAQWSTTDDHGRPAQAFGEICEKHYHLYGAKPPEH